MPTVEIRCAVCGAMKWPSLPERPPRYVCALCRMVEPGKRHQRQLAQLKARETKRRKAAVESSGVHGGKVSPDPDAQPS